eukprot:1159000-Pelagomonas_calceolata.AAC.7
MRSTPLCGSFFVRFYNHVTTNGTAAWESTLDADGALLPANIPLRATAQVIVFSFSKKECEKLALNMAQLDLNDEDEKKLVDTIYWNAMDCLSEVRVRVVPWTA